MTATMTETPMRSQSYRFEGTMTALSGITHFGESMGGTEQVLRREKLIAPDGGYSEVPVISGNSWRGQLRDCGMKAMLNELAVALDVESVRLSPPAFYFLFSGGSLTKDAGKGLDMGLARRLWSLIPLVGVFGGAVGRQILEGKLSVGKIVPVCAETAHLLPDALNTHPHTRSSIYDRLGIEHYTRMDDAKRESLAGRYLPAPAQTLLEAPRTRTMKNMATGEEEETADKPGVAQQMRYGFETLSAGTIFACSIQLRYVTPLEFEAFMAALREWSREPVLGGRSGSGMGRVRLEMGDWLSANPLLREGDAANAVTVAPFGALYREHLATHAAEIVAALETIA